MNDCEILALAFCSKVMSIDSENYFWGKVKSNASDFQNLINRSNYNKLRRNLIAYQYSLTTMISDDLNRDENIFIVDSMPLPVCIIVRAGVVWYCKKIMIQVPIKYILQ